MVASFRPHQRAQDLVLYGLPICRRCLILCEETGEEAKLAQALLFSHLAIAKHKGWNHWRVDPFHDKVCAQSSVLTVCSFRLHQILLEFLVKEIVTTTFFLRFQDKFVRIC